MYWCWGCQTAADPCQQWVPHVFVLLLWTTCRGWVRLHQPELCWVTEHWSVSWGSLTTRSWRNMTSGFSRVFIINRHFSGAGRAINMVYVCLDHNVWSKWLFQMDIWHFRLFWRYLDHVWRSRSLCHSSRSQDEKCIFFTYGCKLQGDVYIVNRQRSALDI